MRIQFWEKWGGVVPYNNRLIYLDSGRNELRFYNKSGDLLSRFEFAGRGPGEFLMPITLGIKGENLFVLDGYQKIIKYQINQDSLKYLTSKRVEFAPEDMCLVNEKVAVRGIKVSRDNPNYEKATIIHLYSTQNLEHIRSIGEGYKSDSYLTINQMSDGPMACIPEEELIIYSLE